MFPVDRGNNSFIQRQELHRTFTTFTNVIQATRQHVDDFLLPSGNLWKRLHDAASRLPCRAGRWWEHCLLQPCCLGQFHRNRWCLPHILLPSSGIFLHQVMCPDLFTLIQFLSLLRSIIYNMKKFLNSYSDFILDWIEMLPCQLPISMYIVSNNFLLAQYKKMKL